MGFADIAKKTPGGWLMDKLGFGGAGGPDPEKLAQDARQAEGGLRRHASAAGRMATEASQNYRAGGQRIQDTEEMLRRRAMGQDSLSAEQLRQGLQQNVAAQQSMAAGARPSNAAMAARTAAMQTGRLGAALSGQQSMAGIAERQAAANALGNLQIGARGQDVDMATSARGHAMQGYGSIMDNRYGLARAAMGQPTEDERWMSMYRDLGMMGMQGSDRRIKTDVDDGDEEAGKFLKGLKAHTYKYKDPKKHGGGLFLGIMAQDLERSKLGKQAVMDTPHGKMVHGARLATALAAATATLDKRLSKLESK
jgi:hypothetical protein